MREKGIALTATVLVLMACFCASVFADTQVPVTTGAAETITTNTAILRGTYTGDGSQIEERGFLYKPTETGDDDYKRVTMHGDNKVAKFGYTLDTLQPDTGYTAMAYVKTATGISYGNEITFRTLAAAPATQPDGVTPDTGMMEDVFTANLPAFLLLAIALAGMVLVRNKQKI
ncbi:MAG: hypothetical protein RR614_07830 [Eubacterium sp.]